MTTELRAASYDIFIDLSRTDPIGQGIQNYLDCLARDAGLANVVGSITLGLSDQTKPPIAPRELQLAADETGPSTVLFAKAVDRAAAMRRHLVVLLGTIVPGNEVLALLIDAFNQDPMLASVQPRFANASTDRIWPLPAGASEDSRAGGTSRTALPLLPPGTITTELAAACIVVKWDVLAATDHVELEYERVAGALMQLLCQARRRGMRNLVLNRAVVPSCLTHAALYPALSEADTGRLRATYPDTAVADVELKALPQRRLEAVLAAGHTGRASRRILLDCRGMSAQYNGSAQCVLGFLDGFAALDCEDEIDLWVWPEVATFHKLTQRYRGWRQIHGIPEDEYFAAVGLTQPWALNTVADLHRRALLVAFTMLDTIAWDVLYVKGADKLGAVWRFVAQHADGLLYISNFTRDRFRNRFPLAPGVTEQVTHLSLLQEEHLDPTACDAPLSDYILVFGNDYDHKAVGATLQVLVDAFPLNRISAFGIADAPGPNVTAIPSGQITNAALHRLIASARVIVYPSFYEGFGLPVVEGLAYGRPVVVRRSPLWAEIAGWSRLPGDLIEFDDVPSLVERVGRALAGLPSCGLPRGVELNGEGPAGWKRCAARIIALLDKCAITADGTRWRAREEALLLAGL